MGWEASWAIPNSKGDLKMRELAMIGLVLTITLVGGCAREVPETPEQAW